MRFVLALAAVAVATTPLAAQPPMPATIAVSAQGETKAIPDRANVTLGVQSRGASASEAARDNAVLQRAIIDTLRSMGFEPGQLTTANYSVRPDFRQAGPNDPPSITGYVVSNTVQVAVRDPGQVSQVIDAALGKGANAVHGLQFYLADPAPARRAAIIDAVARGRADAEALARAAGGTLGPVLEMSTLPMSTTQVFARGGFDGGSMTPVQPGQTSVTAAVTMRWVLVPGR